MSLNKKSVAAYVFMPQFHLCFQGLSHLYPGFMRVLAMMFVQAGILTRNHPATRFGIAGVKKYGVGELVGEAWYNLRNRRGATPYQWGVFASIILMLGAFIGAIANFVFTVAFGAANVAQAQLFSQGFDTSIGAVQGAAALPAGMPFDKRIGTSGSDGGYIYNDYALIMLDKILRSSAGTPQRGGTLQNGITALFQVYNTAITIIAAIMIFWIILSVVVDTAKTGVVGGGRHNMVWAPIRIVFALGLMIPLGTVGYSSGQYCVMKLAEWGSNLGTNGWNAYVTAVTGVSDLLAPVTPENASGLVNGMVQSQVCRVAYNTYVEQSLGGAGGTPNVATLIHAVNSIAPDRAGLQRAWTNTQDANLCGMLVLPLGSGALTGTGGDDTNRMLTQVAGTDLGSAGLSAAINAARNAAINAVSVAIVTNLEQRALQFACAYVPHLMGADPLLGWNEVNLARSATGGGFLGGVNAWGGGYALNNSNGSGAFRTPLPTMNGPGSLCNGSNVAAPCAPAAITATTLKPTLSCHMRMNWEVTGVGGLIANAINNAAAILNAYLTGAGGPGSNTMLGNMLSRGWGGMGIWMNELSTINIQHQANGLPSISFVAGKLAGAANKCQQGFQGGTTSCEPSGIEYKTALILQQYQVWYEKLATQASLPNVAAAINFAAPATPGGYSGTGDMRQEQAEQVDKPQLPGMTDMVWSIFSVQKMMDAVIKRIFGLDNKRDYLWTNLVGNINDTTYPLVNMVVVGNKMVVRGGLTLATATLVQAAIGAFIPGLGLAGSIIFDFAKVMAYSMMTTGLMLTLYIPLLPTIRVAFSVMTWMVMVFEAVVMVPIACLAHLTTEGEGLAAGAKGVWVNWLNVLTRPVLSVFGFIGAFLVFNAWVVYFTDAFAQAAIQSTAQSNVIVQILCQQMYNIVYVTVCYGAANTSFKMLDQIPNALFKWLPFGGSQSENYNGDTGEGAVQKVAGEYSSRVGKNTEDAMNKAGAAAGTALKSMITKGVTKAPPA